MPKVRACAHARQGAPTSRLSPRPRQYYSGHPRVLSRNVAERIAIDFSERNFDVDRVELDRSRAERIQSPALAGTPPDIDALLVVSDQNDLLERGDLLIVRQLLAAIIIGRGWAQYLDD